jgi:uncharacterized membrane protein YeaQ/YmgE (transglycosylase-associated protein family)
MNKVLIGVLAGLVLGALDGATAWFTPSARSAMASILVGSSIKGLLVGLVAGFYARKVNSTGKGVTLAAVIGLILAFVVAVMDAQAGEQHYLQIMLPGFITGAMIGFFTQRYGALAKQS